MHLPKIVRRLFASKYRGVPPTKWNDMRGERVLDPEIRSARELSKIVKRAHWLSVVCFMEQVSPDSLCLTQSLLETVEGEIQHLSEFEPLAVYAAALARLKGAHSDGDL